jgi:hypothetical protein
MRSAGLLERSPPNHACNVGFDLAASLTACRLMGRVLLGAPVPMHREHALPGATKAILAVALGTALAPALPAGFVAPVLWLLLRRDVGANGGTDAR